MTKLRMTMQAIAAFPGSSTPRIVEVSEPAPPAAGQVLCRTLELGVCGTDREILLSRQPLSPPGSPFLVLGHECLAEIVTVGDGVAEFRPGDFVVPVVRRARGVGDSLREPDAGVGESRSEPKTALAERVLHTGEHLAERGCHTNERVDLLPFGAYTERGIVFEHGFSQPLWLDEPRHLFRIERELLSVAVLTEPLAVAAKAINEAIVVQRARLGNSAWAAAPPRVLVTGMGPIGFAALLGSLRRGWPTTLLGRDEPSSFRARLAQEFGGDYLPAEFAAHDARSGYDLVLECTGSEEVLVEASAALAACGVMAWLGSSRAPRPSESNLARMIRDGLLRNHVHLGSVNAAPRDFADALATLAHFQARRPQALARLLTARVSPADALWHYEHREPQGIKTVVEFER